jgi:predicted permease
MAAFPSFRRLLRVRLSPARQAELDVADELRLHLDLRTEELMAEGMAEEEARREAQRAFGDPERARRELIAPARRRMRRMHAGEWLGDVARDVRHGARSLLRAPAFAAVAVLTLALGIGATTAMFSIVDAVLLEALPFAEPDELAMIFEARDDDPDARNVVNPGNFNDWRARARSFESMAAIYTFPVTLLTGGEPREVVVQLADPAFFGTLGVRPLLGRVFTAEEAAVAPGAGQVVVVSERFWREQMGSSPNAPGQMLELVGSRVEVIGVMPAELDVIAPDAAFWSPSDYSWGNRQDMGRFITVIGRLADGVTLDAAQREMQAIAADLRREAPDFNARWTTNVVALTEHLSGDVRVMMLVVLGAVAVLLLIACVNVANLLLARAATRRTEIAVRASLGAGRGRIARALMLESMVLALCGGAVGVALAYGATRALVASVPDSLRIARLASVSVDASVLLFALAASLLTGLLFGIAPVVEAFRTNLAGMLREGGRGSGGARRARRTRATLVVAQVAMSLVLLTGAGLLLRSLLELQRTDLGFNPQQVVTGRVTMRGERYSDGAARVAFFDQAIASIAALPAVQSAGMIWWLPLSGGASATNYYLPDRPRPVAGQEPITQVQAVQGDVFRALGIPLLQGRAFDARDQAGGARVVIVNRAFAESVWPGESPLGRRVVLPWGEDLDMEVVGVAGDIRHRGVDQPGEPTMFLPHAQFTQFASANLIVRTADAAPGAQREIVERVHDIDPTLAVADVMPMGDVFADAVARPRLTSVLVAVFALLALVLAAVGIYGVVSYTVAQRAREMGVRRALGARTADVAGMVLRDALRLGGAGIGIGVLVALVATRVLESLLYGVRPDDPIVLLGTAALLLGVTVVAALVPAWRAARVSPTEAIRYE